LQWFFISLLNVEGDSGAGVPQLGLNIFDVLTILHWDTGVLLPDFWGLFAANFAVSALRDQEADPLPPSPAGSLSES